MAIASRRFWSDRFISVLCAFFWDQKSQVLHLALERGVFRKIRQKCFLRQGEPNWAEHCAMFSSVVNTALIYEVPLVVWGEDIAVEFGGLQRAESKPSALAINKSDLIKENTAIP